MRRGAAVAASSLALLIAGCGVLAGTAAERSAVEPVSAGCPEESSSQKSDSGTWYSAYDLLPSGLDTTAVVRCLPKVVTDETGRWSAVVRQTVSGDDTQPLLEALRLDDVPKPLNGACDASLSLLPWLAVVLRDGRWQPVGVPVDACGHPRSEAVAALDAAPWSEDVPMKVTRIQTRAEVTMEDLAGDAGCAYQWKDEIGLIGKFSGQVPTQTLPATGRITACRFTIAGPGEDGTWVGGGVVPRKDADAVRAAIVPTAAAASCTAPRSGFIVLTGADGNFVTVDLSCPRLLAGDSLGSLPQKSVDLLVSLTPDA